jgi:WD40 repeat protein
VAVLRGHSRPVVALAFDDSGRVLASASTDGTARIWDVGGQRLEMQLRHPGPVVAVDMSPDGRFVVTGSFDKSARVWEAATGLLLMQMATPSPVTSVDFGPDGRTIAVAGPDSAVRLYTCELCGSLNDLVRYADRRLHRRLTASERATYLHQKGEAP